METERLQLPVFFGPFLASITSTSQFFVSLIFIHKFALRCSNQPANVKRYCWRIVWFQYISIVHLSPHFLDSQWSLQEQSLSVIGFQPWFVSTGFNRQVSGFVQLERYASGRHLWKWFRRRTLKHSCCMVWLSRMHIGCTEHAMLDTFSKTVGLISASVLKCFRLSPSRYDNNGMHLAKFQILHTADSADWNVRYNWNTHKIKTLAFR